MGAGLSQDLLVNAFGIGLLIAGVAVFVGYDKGARDAGERKRVTAMIPLFVGGIAFFTVFEQASTWTLYAVRRTTASHREYFGFHIVASAYQFINAFCIIALAPLFAWIWLRLAKAKREPTSVSKFAIGTIFTTLSVMIMLPTLATVSHVDGITKTAYLVQGRAALRSAVAPFSVSPNLS